MPARVAMVRYALGAIALCALVLVEVHTARTHVGRALAAGIREEEENGSSLDADVFALPAGSRRRLSGGGKDDYAGAKQSLASALSHQPWRMLLSTALVLCLGSLAAGAGVGGGGLFVPIYWLILGVGPLAAVPLSKATILGGAIGNFATLGWQRHPLARRPLIDYEASTFMQSGELLGVIFGVLLNILLPPVAIIVFLIMILSYNTLRTLRKGYSARAKEDAAIAKKSEDAATANDDTETKATMVSEESSVSLASSSASSSHSHQALLSLDKNSNEDLSKHTETGGVSPELRALLEKDSVQFPIWAWRLLAPMTTFTVIYAVVKAKALSQCQPAWYWLWFFTPIPVMSGFMVYTYRLLKKRHLRRVTVGFEYLSTDIQWSAETLSKFPTTALIAGVTAGLLGIGGGMIIGPLFLEIGMQPQVGTSSCAFMILWTAASGVIQYFFYGKLGWQLTAWCVGFGFISGQLGQHAVNKVLKETGRPSYVIFLLAAIIGLACTCMAAAGIATLGIDLAKGESIFFIELYEFKCRH